MSATLIKSTLLVFLFCLILSIQGKEIGPLKISAAISLKNLIMDIDQSHQKKRYNFAGTNTLYQQILRGASVDIFVSANQFYLDQLEKKGLLKKRIKLFSNKLVFVRPKSIKNVNSIHSQEIKKMALANPAVPLGHYSKIALSKYPIKSQIVYTDNAQATLELVKRAIVQGAIVYLSDALTALNKIDIVEQIPLPSNESILYEAALLNTSQNPKEGLKYLELIGPTDHKNIIQKHSFSLLDD